MKRVFLLILDSCGAGALPDAADYGDAGTHTLKSCYDTGLLDIPNLKKLGIGNIEGLDFLGRTDTPAATVCRVAELSRGKDTTIGHWEIAGVISEKPLPTYPDGFPEEILKEFSEKTGRGVLCNKPYSGTEVIRDYGQEHLRTGDLIVYTSADSVFQIAAHEDLVPPEELYRYCRIARSILQGEHAVGRVIARPFIGEPGAFTRTANRHDFSLEPTGKTMLDALKENGRDVIAVGKITDIFAGRGITRSILTHSNAEGMEVTEKLASEDFHGLCFTNLVEFDMLYGHRNDAVGYARALNAFDAWLGTFLPKLGQEDVLMIAADHGCDPADVSTDHTREYTPLLIYTKQGTHENLGTLPTFSCIASSICQMLETPYRTQGESFCDML